MAKKLHKVDINKVVKVLKKEVKSYDVPIVELIEVQTKDPFKVLVTTILSARTKDETTGAAVKRLFKVVNKPKDFEKLTQKQLEKIIYPVGFYRNKAKHLKELPGVMKELYSGKVPDTVEELVKLPGVGRKTANLVVAVAHTKPAICVDVHVHRICNRLGYVKTKTPHETEMVLREKLPKRHWMTFNTILVMFGQNLCRPTSPKCSICPVYDECNRVGVTRSR